MLIEKSAGAVIFRKEKGIIRYLLLRYHRGTRTPNPYWDFAKGHIDKELEAAKREIFEETGLQDIKFISDFKEVIKYSFKIKNKTILKTVVFFLAETKTKEIKISQEHIGYKWLPYKQTLEQLTFENAKEILKKANTFF